MSDEQERIMRMNNMTPAGFSYHEDTNIGQTDSGDTVVQLENHGKPCWKATSRITSIFGHDVQGGELEAFGNTKEEALARLQQEKKEFNDSLWA